MGSLPPYFFSCDWGTSAFRLRLVRTEDGQPIADVSTSDGVKVLATQLSEGPKQVDRAAAFRDYLSSRLEELAGRHPEWAVNAPVIVSGMASSSVGWRELPYARVPFAVDGSGARFERLELARAHSIIHPVLLVSGLATVSDMMRGEETELIGMFALPEMAGMAQQCLVVLPGTHSKHIRIAAGQVTDFRTYMTGELFQVLTEHSILRFTTRSGDGDTNLEAFQEGVQAALVSGLAGSVFQARSRAILNARPAAANRAFLSGLLVGAELCELHKIGEETPLVLAAAGALGPLYELATETLGFGGRLRSLDEGQMKRVTILGHTQLLRHCGY